ncbi:MAG TPA: zinc-binding dehydrogenase [Sumerlaeia bacterium]|nr:zinc-binding dehydrogenase [Sumerlaeia bacterium]
MQIVKIVGERRAELVDAPDPRAKDEFVVVKIHAAPMCTEYHAFKAGNVCQSIGHEAAGEVVEVAQPGKVKAGDRVVVMPQHPCGKCHLCLKGEYIHCQNNLDVAKVAGYAHGTGTYAQCVLKQDWLLVPIPEGMSYEHAGMACCGLGPTFGAMQRMAADAFDTILISGLGPVGLGGVVNAVHRGARVIGVDGHPYRAALAKELGAQAVVDPSDENALGKIMDLTGGIGVDKAIETSGFAEAKPLLMNAVRRNGHAAFVGWSGQVDVSTIIAKGLTLHGAWHWNLGDSPRMMRVIAESGQLLDKHITHTFPMSRVQEAFELQVTGNCGKVILHPWK